MHPELVEMVDREAAVLRPLDRWPTPEPAAEATQAWLDDVRRLRDQHDAAAIIRSRASDLDDVTRSVEVAFHDVPTDGGTITAAVYTPPSTAPRPVILYFHGGGWWMGGGASNFALNDELCRGMALAFGATVVNVDYRLAPEHRYPSQLADGIAAVQWVQGNCSTLGVDPDDIMLVGASSGGHLAASVSLVAPQRGLPQLTRQLLIVPCVDATMSAPELQDEPDVARGLSLLRDYYFTGVDDLEDPSVSPVMAPDLSAMPPTVVIAAEHDVLRDQARLLVRRLGEQGVPSRLLEYPMTHTTAVPDVRGRILAEAVAALQEVVR
ncbi:MAG: alpha/beta hydrolase [Aeromicrobium sp.]